MKCTIGVVSVQRNSFTVRTVFSHVDLMLIRSTESWTQVGGLSFVGGLSYVICLTFSTVSFKFRSQVGTLVEDNFL